MTPIDEYFMNLHFFITILLNKCCSKYSNEYMLTYLCISLR